MADTPPEDLMEWLMREEERLGIAKTQRATLEIEEAKEMLFEELGYEPTEAQVDSFMETGKTRYEIMPEVGVTSRRYERVWGYQMVYTDVPTGKFLSYAEVSKRIKAAWVE